MAKYNTELTVETLRLLLDYDPVSGDLRWKKRPVDFFNSQNSCNAWNGKHFGKTAMACIYRNRRYGTILGVGFHACRVVWCMQTGKWPNGDVFSINGNAGDLTFENLKILRRGKWQKTKSPRCICLRTSEYNLPNL